MRVAPQPTVGTMAVQACGEEVLLLHNPAFVLDISVAELVGVLLHEVRHILFGHLSMKIGDHTNLAALTIAQDVTVNEFVAEPLPGSPVLLEQYPMLPPHQSSEERYRRLEKLIPVVEAVVTLDDHGVWDRDGSGQETIRHVIEDALMVAGPEQVPGELRDLLKSWGIGTKSGDDIEEVLRDRRGTVDWRRLLRRYTGQVLEVRPVYNRPHRRFPELVGIVPGQGRQAAKPKIMVVIDTSGSVTNELLTLIDGELARLARSHSVLVVECDCRIQRVYSYRKLTVVWGRGGTDLCPPLEKDFLRQHHPDLVMYFTDGFGPAPECKPNVPVIWCIVPGGRVPTTWGRRIHLSHSDVRKV
jgi:predicted metal-dependent peptidase